VIKCAIESKKKRYCSTVTTDIRDLDQNTFFVPEISLNSFMKNFRESIFYNTNHNKKYTTMGYAQAIAVGIRSINASFNQTNISA
jgi:hypothetical protein